MATRPVIYLVSFCSRAFMLQKANLPGICMERQLQDIQFDIVINLIVLLATPNWKRTGPYEALCRASTKI